MMINGCPPPLPFSRSPALRFPSAAVDFGDKRRVDGRDAAVVADLDPQDDVAFEGGGAVGALQERLNGPDFRPDELPLEVGHRLSQAVGPPSGQSSGVPADPVGVAASLASAASASAFFAFFLAFFFCFFFSSSVSSGAR